MTRLVADIGGTHARFAFSRGGELISEPVVLSSAAPLMELVSTVLEGGPVPEDAVFALAGPVIHQRCATTNLPWVVDATTLSDSLRRPVRLLNDFEAAALGVPRTPSTARVEIRAGTVDPHGIVGVIGPGTGLGQAFGLPTQQGLRVFPTEGGHADFAPRTALEDAVLACLRQRFPDHVSVERVLSGPGLAVLYEVVCARESQPARWLGAADPPRAIVENAASDFGARRAVEVFAELLGAECGNMALKLMPTGGLYLAGGLVPRVLDVVRERFDVGFLAKGRMRPVLERMPVWALTDPWLALRGAAAVG